MAADSLSDGTPFGRCRDMSPGPAPETGGIASRGDPGRQPVAGGGASKDRQAPDTKNTLAKHYDRWRRCDRVVAVFAQNHRQLRRQVWSTRNLTRGESGATPSHGPPRPRSGATLRRHPLRGTGGRRVSPRPSSRQPPWPHGGHRDPHAPDARDPTHHRRVHGDPAEPDHRFSRPGRKCRRWRRDRHFARWPWLASLGTRVRRPSLIAGIGTSPFDDRRLQDATGGRTQAAARPRRGRESADIGG